MTGTDAHGFSLLRMRPIVVGPSITGMCMSSRTMSNCLALKRCKRLHAIHGFDDAHVERAHEEEATWRLIG